MIKLLLTLAVCVMWSTALCAATLELEFVSVHHTSIAFYVSSLAALGLGGYLFLVSSKKPVASYVRDRLRRTKS